MQNIVIVGAGAMGCLFAARLAEAGAGVTLVDVDAARLAVLDGEGIALSDDDGERVVPVRAALARDVKGPVDLVMLFTKGMHSAAAIRSVAHLADGRAYALTLQNGIGNAEIIAEIFAPGRVLMGVTDLPADLEGPRRVESHGKGHIRLGGFTAEAQTAAEAAATLLNRGRLNAEADADIQVAVWEKVAFNAALNALATVTGLTVGGMDEAPGRRIAAAIVGEVVDTAAAKGIRLDRPRIDAKVAFALANHRGHKASMLQDRLAGRPTEIESINGAIVREAEHLGISTPVTSTLADLVRLLETARS
jgi:2-dehydropantoate 2-reductase